MTVRRCRTVDVETYRLATHLKYRRLGIARLVVGSAEGRIPTLGVRRIAALVERDHLAAVAFWVAVGHVPDARMARHARNLPST